MQPAILIALGRSTPTKTALPTTTAQNDRLQLLLVLPLVEFLYRALSEL
jgi:hypothetical protein